MTEYQAIQTPKRPALDKGQVYKLDTGLMVVIKGPSGGGFYDCIVIDAPVGSSYPVGGYDISVAKSELLHEAVLMDMRGLV